MSYLILKMHVIIVVTGQQDHHHDLKKTKKEMKTYRKTLEESLKGTELSKELSTKYQDDVEV